MKNKLIGFFQGMGWYFLPQIAFWLVSVVFLFQQREKKAFLMLNAFHFPAIDHPLLWFTELSGGYILVSLFVLLYARSRPATAIMGAILIFISWYAAITIKYNNFPHWKSPSTYFKTEHIHFLGNQQLLPELNFPSAHAAMIAALFTFTAWLYRHSKAEIFLTSFVVVFLSCTRIYTGWSYLGDIISGSILGTAIGILTTVWLINKIERWYERRNQWWQNMIVAILRTAAICTILVNLKYFVI